MADFEGWVGAGRSNGCTHQGKFTVARYFGFNASQQVRSMNMNYNRPLLLIMSLLLMSIGMPATGTAQNWQDPALQQPVQQYFSGNRYPLKGLNDMSPASPPVTLPKPVTVTPTPKPKAETNTKTKGKTRPVKKTPVDKKTASQPKKKSDKKTSKAKPKSKAGGKKTAKAKKKTKVDPHHPVKTWDVYRDRSPYPIDPRKPCSVCKREVGSCTCGCQFPHRGIGNQGMPHQDIEPGGRSCGKKCCSEKRPEYSVYWPKPLSARRENRNYRDGCCEGCGHTKCRCRKVNDLFDHLVNFKLIDYQRKDNAYCGPGADPYGCLGESRTHVADIGFQRN